MIRSYILNDMRDELRTRAEQAFHSILDIENIFIEKIYEKLYQIEGIERYEPINCNKELQEEVSGSKFQPLATEIHMLFIGLTAINLQKFPLVEDTKEITRTITEFYKKRYEIQDVELKIYTNAISLIGISKIFGERLANLFGHKDKIIINDLSKLVINLNEQFIKTIEPSIITPIEKLVSKEDSPWTSVLGFVTVIIIVIVINYPEILSLNLNLILFIVAFISSFAFIYLYRQAGENSLKNLAEKNIFLKVFISSYFTLCLYLSIISFPAFFALAALVGLVFLLKIKVLDRLTTSKTNSPFKNFLIVVTKPVVILFGFFIMLWMLNNVLTSYAREYEEKAIKNTDPNVYVDACRVDSDSCYKLEAHYIPQACAPVEYDTRGAHGGRCYRDAYIEKIHFKNEGYVKFKESDCEYEGNKTWSCSNEDGDDWYIEITGRIK